MKVGHRVLNLCESASAFLHISMRKVRAPRKTTVMILLVNALLACFVCWAYA